MPTLEPLLIAPIAVQLHVSAALFCIILLPLTLLRRKRDRLHKTAGDVWVVTMASAALSSFFIRGLGPFGGFSAIHIISVFTLFGLWQGVRAAIRRDLVAHQSRMRGIAIGGLGVAGVLSFMPGRRMNEVVFGTNETLGFALILGVALVALGLYFWRDQLRSLTPGSR